MKSQSENHFLIINSASHETLQILPAGMLHFENLILAYVVLRPNLDTPLDGYLLASCSTSPQMFGVLPCI